MADNDYEMPWEYSFPPFYTLQHHEETRKRQVALWADIILKYLKSVKRNKLSVNTSSPIFTNETIGRKVTADLVLKVIESLNKSGYAHSVDKDGVEWNICWHTIEEYADMIYNWAEKDGHINAICTLYEISTAILELSEIDEDILLKSLHKLEERGKSEVINIDGTYGVKFF